MPGGLLVGGFSSVCEGDVRRMLERRGAEISKRPLLVKMTKIDNLRAVLGDCLFSERDATLS